MTNLILHQFPSSHFNEKARWALDFKQATHQRINYLPGPHQPKIKKLTAGAGTTTPVLTAESAIQGSDNIIEYLETTIPEPPLYPNDANEKEAALAWQSRLDAELGPAVRTVVFAVFIHEPGFLAKTFTSPHPLPTRLLYRALLPFVMPIIKKANGADNDENIQQCQNTVDAYLAEIAGIISSKPYLVGDSFTVADLTAAALLAPLAKLNHPDMKRPEPIPAVMQSLIDAFAQHPTIRWVHGIYDQHRPNQTA